MIGKYEAYDPLKGILSFKVGKLTQKELEWLQGHLEDVLEVSLSEHRQKRGLSANAYFWVLVNELAKVQNISDREVHDRLLTENIAYFMNDGVFDWRVADWETNEYNLHKEGNDYYLDSLQRVTLAKDDGTPYKDKAGNPKTSKIFWHIKGTHQMDSKEMSRIIESTVYEAKQNGIKTLDEIKLERMVNEWESARKGGNT